MYYCEINGNLCDSAYGLKNYNFFERNISIVEYFFKLVFGEEILSRVPFYIDNAISGSGYTPIATPLFKRIVVIKLGINDNDSGARIVYQFAHELTHVVFWDYFGLDKPKANDDEEAVCTAASLICVKNMYPSDYERFANSAKNSGHSGYMLGPELAEELNFDMDNVRKRIEAFDYPKCEKN